MAVTQDSIWGQRSLAPKLAAHRISYTQPARPRPSLYSEAEWQAVYSTIHRLYVVERLKLSQVMAIMERKHGFKATYASLLDRIGSQSVTQE